VIAWHELEPSDAMQLAVVGDPVSQSLSPVMHQAALDHLGIPGSYHPLRVRLHEFEPCIAHLAAVGFTGVNVTIPHKVLAAQLAGKDSLANWLSAANTLKFTGDRIEAVNTDLAGFLAPISGLPPGIALVLGAGGAAAAAVYGLTSNGWAVNVWNRSTERANALAQRFDTSVVPEPNPAECSLVVNATPLGLADEMPPLVWGELSDRPTVYDMVYRLGLTPFLRKAASMGCATVDGREMLVEQGAASLEWWLGKPAPRGVMRKAVGL